MEILKRVAPRVHAELMLGLGLSVNLKRVTLLVRAAGKGVSTGADTTMVHNKLLDPPVNDCAPPGYWLPWAPLGIATTNS